MKNAVVQIHHILRRISRRDAIFLIALVYFASAASWSFMGLYSRNDDLGFDIEFSLQEENEILGTNVGKVRHLLEEIDLVFDSKEELRNAWETLKALPPVERAARLRGIQVRTLMRKLPPNERLNRFGREVDPYNDEDLSCVHTPMDDPTKSECYQLLSPAIQSKQAWFFAGDSQMGKIFGEIQFPYQITTSRGPQDKRCGFLSYAGLPAAKHHERKFPSFFQGPSKYGREHDGCSDVKSVGARFIESALPNKTNHFMEIMTVDHASDTAQQTPYTSSTQETAALHFANQLQFRGMTFNDSVCIMNTGLHDQKLCVGKSHEHCLIIYHRNVVTYLNLMHNVCGAMVWISTTPVRDPGNPEYPQSNAMSQDMNMAAKEIMKRFKNGFFLDTWAVGMKSEFVDNAHFTRPYYVGIAELFASLM